MASRTFYSGSMVSRTVLENMIANMQETADQAEFADFLYLEAFHCITDSRKRGGGGSFAERGNNPQQHSQGENQGQDFSHTENTTFLMGSWKYGPLCGMIAQAKEKRQGPGKTEKKRMPGMMAIDREDIRLYADADPEERKP